MDRLTELIVDIRNKPTHWTVAVTDRGVGMLAEQIRKTGSASSSGSEPNDPWLGLRLVPVQALVRLNSGEVLIEE